MYPQIAERYREQLSGPSKASARRAQISGISLGVSNFVIFGVYALGFWYGSVEIENGTMTFEQMNTVRIDAVSTLRWLWHCHRGT